VRKGKTKGSLPADRQTFRRLKFWVWFQEHTRPTDLQVTLFWAGVIGFCGGLSSIAFRAATGVVHKILTGSSDSSLVESFAGLPPLLRLLIPALGGLIAGAILQFGARFRSRIPTTDYMEAVVLGDGKISTRRTFAKSLSALFSIASGGSIGREGPLVQISSSLRVSAAYNTGPRRDCVFSSVAVQPRESLRLTMRQSPARSSSPKLFSARWRWKCSVR
jgi:CIC family chloride channel protein